METFEINNNKFPVCLLVQGTGKSVLLHDKAANETRRRYRGYQSLSASECYRMYPHHLDSVPFGLLALPACN